MDPRMLEQVSTPQQWWRWGRIGSYDSLDKSHWSSGKVSSTSLVHSKTKDTGIGSYMGRRIWPHVCLRRIGGVDPVYQLRVSQVLCYQVIQRILTKDLHACKGDFILLLLIRVHNVHCFILRLLSRLYVQKPILKLLHWGVRVGVPGYLWYLEDSSCKEKWYHPSSVHP